MIEKPHYKTAIIRKEHFNAAHRLHNKHWSDAKNIEIFGKCNNPNYHVHNYELEVKLKGYCNVNKGYIVDTKIVSHLIKNHILDKLDHKNLNLDVIEFKELNPTAENIAMLIYEALRPHLDTTLELNIKLYETSVLKVLSSKEMINSEQHVTIKK